MSASLPAPDIPAPRPRLRPREVLWASLLYLAAALVYFHGPILSNGISQQNSLHTVPGEGLAGATEDTYQGFPPFYYAARQIRQGKLPLWTPHACGGTPFIGKQQSRVFSPFKPLFYLSPPAAFQYLWLAAFLLQFYFAWLATFLLARWHGIGFGASAFAAACYTFSVWMTDYKIECPGEAAIYAPALFLAAEQFLHGARRKALLVLPWLVAFCVLAGHLQTAFYAGLSLAAYVLFLTWKERRSPAAFWAGAAAFCGAGGLGLLFAAGPLATGLEYISRSYTAVWRSLPQFGWFLSRISRQLGVEDAACLSAGLAALGLFIWCLRKMRLRAADFAPGWAWPWLLGTVALGASLACLRSVGLWDPVLLAGFSSVGSAASPVLVFGVLAHFLALFALLDERLPRGLGVMAWLLLAGSLLILRAPPLVQLLYQLPVLRSITFHQYQGVVDLAAALLAGYGLWRVQRLAGLPWQQRRAPCLRALQLAGLAVAALLLGGWLRAPAAGLLGTGRDPRYARDGGGISDAGQVSGYETRHVIRGWVPELAAGRGLAVGLQGDAWQEPRTRRQDGRLYFSRTVDLPAGASVPVAAAVDSQGRQSSWRGSEVTRLGGPAPWAWAALAGMFLLLPALLLLPRALTWGLCGALFAAYLVHISAGYHGEPDNLTRQWPALQRIEADPDLKRIFSFDQFFYPPELSSVHGVSDIRNGGDNLDVAAMVHFLELARGLAQGAKDREWGSQLLGLGNVKYVIARPKDPLALPGLELVQGGEDALVYRNKEFVPRVKLFGRWRYADGSALGDWMPARQMLGRLYEQVARGALDLREELLIHDRPPEDFPQESSAAGPAGRVEVVEQDADRLVARVESQRPGLLYFSSNHFPGWKAFVDGKPERLLRSWITFCAVPVRPGRHLVHFVYSSARADAALALAALAAAFWAFWWWRWRSAPDEPPAAPAAAPRRRAKPARAAEEASEARDGWGVLEAVVLGAVWVNLLWWAVWCAWVYRGGLAGKAVAACRVLFAGRSWAEAGWLGAPYAMGRFEGWPVNLAAALLLAVGLWAMVRGCLRAARRAQP